ncbi:MAG: hypothetical protein HUJ30_04990 [Gammaproteobacteria bacterium]|nr:hypothetical protein [Gammaproteobacteria bacterium]
MLSQNKFQLMAFILFVVTLGLSILLFKPEPTGSIFSDQSNSVLLGEQSACDAAMQRCELRLENGRNISFKMSSPVISLKPVEFSVLVHGYKVQPDIVSVIFTMSGMDMGWNQFPMQLGDNGWHGTGMLPVCSSERRDWMATVIFHLNKQTYRAAFHFTSQ